MSNVALIANAVLAVVVLVCYTLLVSLHDDGSVLLGVLGGQGLSVGVGKIVDKVV